LKGDGKRSAQGVGGADHLSDKCYLHYLEFSETCLECQGNVREFYSGGLVGTLRRKLDKITDNIKTVLCIILKLCELGGLK